MIKKVSLSLMILILASACVSSKVHKELEEKYNALKTENRALYDQNDTLTVAKNALESELKQLKSAYDDAIAKRDKFEADYKTFKSKYDNLKRSYDALEKNSSMALAENTQKNRELLKELEGKEQALASENLRLEKLKKELEDRSNRVAELEHLIASKDAAMKELKNTISKALTDFEGKGLTVEMKDGKVYVSMENKLLFNSGSWAVGTEGTKAVKQLGEVLGNNPDISILIEGHTDNDPYLGTGGLSGNWDLSTKRATAIVSILKDNPKINPGNLTAAGRGEHAPIASNTTEEGKAKNRRIEVILTPKLDELSKLLGDN